MSKEREALNWEPIREFWRNNSGVNWDELEAVIKEALAQPAQEPVACIGYWNQKTGAFYKPDQLSSAHQKLIEDGILRRCYINSPQRTWVGLTPDDFIGMEVSDAFEAGAWWADVTLREKNT